MIGTIVPDSSCLNVSILLTRHDLFLQILVFQLTMVYQKTTKG